MPVKAPPKSQWISQVLRQELLNSPDQHHLRLAVQISSRMLQEMQRTLQKNWIESLTWSMN